MQKPKVGDQLSFTDKDGDFTTLMALVGNDAKVLGTQGIQYIPLSNLSLSHNVGGIGYWLIRSPAPSEGKSARELPKWTITLSWYGQPFTYTVHGKTERAAVAAACALLSPEVQKKPALVTNTVWNKGWYVAKPLTVLAMYRLNEHDFS